MEYYHLIVEKKTYKTNERNFNIYDYDKDKNFIINKIIKPYLNDEKFIVNGYTLDGSLIERLKIVKTNEDINTILNRKQSSVPSGVFIIWSKQDVLESDGYVEDVTQQLIDETNDYLNKSKEEIKMINNQKESKYIFIVHGHDLNRVIEVENLVRCLGYEPIVLFKEADAGQTIIEKIETYTSKACYGIVLYTKCDYGFAANHEKDIKPRARQNVVFEHGYLMAKLRRDHVCALVDGDDIETPGDISGIVYQSFDDNGFWKFKIAQNMAAIGINVDMNKIK